MQTDGSDFTEEQEVTPGGIVFVGATDADLIKLRLHKVDPPELGGNYALVFTSPKIKIWKNPNRTGAVTSGSADFSATSDHVVYVEGTFTRRPSC